MLKRRPRIALIFAATTAVAGAAVTTTLVAHAATAGCQVTYTVPSQWNTGFTGNVTVTNLGDPITAWTLKWSFTAGQTVSQAWNATATQSGSTVTATNASWNGNLATNAGATFGFNATWNGSANPAPTTFTLNGVACNGPAGPTTPVPTSAKPPTSAPPSPTPTPTRTTSPTPTPTPTSTGSQSGPPPVPGTPGTWTAVPVNPFNGGAGTFMWLMTDGSI